MTKNLADELQRTARQALAGLQPVAQGDEFGGLPFRRLLAAAFRGRYLVFGTTLFGLLIGLFMAITTANSYVSEGRFQFSSSGAERLRVDAASASQTSQESIAAGATYILNSDDLLERVIKRLGAQRILQPYEPGEGESNGLKALFFGIQRDWNATAAEDRTPEAALRYLKKAIFVDRPRFTEILNATCTANNPELAREILQAWMDEAVNFHIEKYDDTKAYTQAETNYNESVTKLESADRALKEFMLRKADVPSFNGEMERLEVEVGGAAGRASDLREQIRIAERRIAETRKKLEGPDALPPTVKIKVKQSATSAEAIVRLESRIVDREVELEGVRQVYSDPNHPELESRAKEIRAMRETRNKMKEELRNAPLVDEEIDNPELKKAQADLQLLEAELLEDRVMLTEAEAQHADKDKKLRRLLELEPEYSRLVNAKLQAETDNKAAQFVWNSAQQKRALGEGNYSSLQTVQAATLPLEKEGPARGKLVLGAFLVGLFLGLGVLVLRTLPDTVVRTRDDLEQIEGLAVIGVMPTLEGKNLRRHLALREQGW